MDGRDVKADEFIGINYLCTVEMKALYSIRESLLGAVCLDFRKLLSESNSTLCSHKALVGISSAKIIAENVV